MKKIAALLLALLLCIALCSCGEQNQINIDPAEQGNIITDLVPDPEPLPDSEEKLCGDWYALRYGLVIDLKLEEDGKYTLTVPSLDEKTGEGKWALKDVLIFLDGADTADFCVLEDGLDWIGTDIVFTRQMPQGYVPGDRKAAAAGGFDGYWKAEYVRMMDSYVPADMLDDNTDIYIEGTNVALGGAILGDVLAVFEEKDGALFLRLGEAEGSPEFTIELLEDGMMRLTVYHPP